MDAVSLLAELQDYNHHQRWQFIVNLTRQQQPKQLTALVEELGKGDFFSQYVALQISIVSRNSEYILACLNSGSRLVRTTATNVCLKICGDSPDFARLVLDSPDDARRKILGQIGRSQQTKLAEDLVKRLPADDVRDIARLLPACSSPVVEQYLAICESKIKDWSRIKAPDVVLQFLEQRFADSSILMRLGLWYRYGGAVEKLSQTQPAAVIRLLGNYCKNFAQLPPGLQRMVLRLYKEHPDSVAPIILSPSALKNFRTHGIESRLIRWLLALRESDLLTLISSLLPKSFQLVRLFTRMAPSRRRDILDELERQGRLESDWDINFLRILPYDWRHRQAAQILSENKHRSLRRDRLQITALLPFDDAVTELDEAARLPKAQERGIAYRQLVLAGALEGRLTEVLTLLQRTSNDQCAVRELIFSGFCEASPRSFRDEHVPLLTDLLKAALEARDTSPSLHSWIQVWLLSLVAQNSSRPKCELFQFALKWLRQLAKHTGSLRLPSLCPFLPRGTEIGFVDVLADVLENANKRERFDGALQLAAGLGRRGWGIERLQTLVQEALSAHDKYTRAGAIDWWLSDPKTRDERTEQLLREDPSVITQRRVFQHVHRRRQDLLDPYLDGTAKKGQFLSGKTVYLLPAAGQFYTWLPRQQRAFAKMLDAFVRRKSVSDWEKRSALRAKATMPATTIDDFTEQLEGKSVVLQEAALAALPLLDEIGAGIPILMENLDSDRARVAMYALPNCFKELSSESRLATVAQLLEGKAKVTVHKEAVRMLGQFASQEAADMLDKFAGRQDLHRDVRIAVGHAARQLLNHDCSWRILERLIGDDHAVVCGSMIGVDAFAMTAKERRRYAEMLVPLAEHDDEEVRRQLFTECHRWQAYIVKELAQAAGARILKLDESAEWDAAVLCLAALAAKKRAHSAILDTIQGLAAEPDQPPTEERDSPALQRLAMIVSGMETLALSTRRQIVPLFETAAEHLFTQVRTRQLAVRLSVAAVKWRTAEAAQQLDAIARRLDAMPLTGARFLEYVTRSLSSHEFSVTEEFTAVIDSLSSSESVLARMTAIQVLARMGNDCEWSKSCRERLRTLREDQDEEVQSRAYEVFCVPESSPAVYGHHAMNDYDW